MVFDKNNPGLKKLLEALHQNDDEISSESDITIVEVTGRAYTREIKKLLKQLASEQQATQSVIEIWAGDKNTFRNDKVRKISDALMSELKNSGLNVKISHENDGFILDEWLKKSPE